MQCSFVHFRSGDIVINGDTDDVSLSRLTCWDSKQIKNKLFNEDYPRQRYYNHLCPMPVPANLDNASFDGTISPQIEKKSREIY